jgi:hypothetical protein
MSIRSNARVATMRSFEFEDLVADLFRAKGFLVEQDARIGGMEVDILVDHGDDQIPVEVSAVKQANSLAKLRVDAERLKSLLAEVPGLAQPIVVVGSALTPKAKAWVQSQYLIQVWDLNDLLAQAAHYPSVSQRLQHFIGEEGDDTRPKLADGETDELVDRLVRHIADRDSLSPSEYEALCMSVFIKLSIPICMALKGRPKQQTVETGTISFAGSCPAIRFGTPSANF